MNKSSYILLAIFDQKIHNNICNDSCYLFNYCYGIQFFYDLFITLDQHLENCFNRYLLNRITFEKTEFDNTNKEYLISLIKCSESRMLYKAFLNPHSFSMFIINFCKKTDKPVKFYNNKIRACINAFEGNSINMNKIMNYIKKIVLDNKFILYGHSAFNISYYNNELYVLGNDIYNLEKILYELYHPLFNVMALDNIKISLMLNYSNKDTFIVHFKSNIRNTCVFRYETIAKNKKITYSLFNLSKDINEIQNEYLQKKLSLIDRSVINDQNICNVIHSFYKMENMLKKGWTFNGIIPFNYANHIFYNISRSKYLEILSNILIFDVASIIIDYINIPNKYIPLKSDNPIFFIEDLF